MKREKGQALVEIALAIPVLLFLLCAIIDFGRILYAANTINMISQEAVRYAGLGRSDIEVIDFAENNAPLGDIDNLLVTLSPDDETRGSGDYVTVYIEYSIEYITPFMDQILDSPYQMHTQSTIRVE